MNRKKKRDPRRRHRPEPLQANGLTEPQNRILIYLATEFERHHGRWPEPGDVLMIDEDGVPVRRGTGAFPERP